MNLSLDELLRGFDSTILHSAESDFEEATIGCLTPSFAVVHLVRLSLSPTQPFILIKALILIAYIVNQPFSSMFEHFYHPQSSQMHSKTDNIEQNECLILIH